MATNPTISSLGGTGSLRVVDNGDTTTTLLVSGGGGAVTIANGADTVEGTLTDTATSGATITNGSWTINSLLKGIYNALIAALPAGSNIIGKVGIDQTTVGTTNAVSIAQVGATTVVTGGVNGSLGVGGVTASGASVTGNPVQTGGRAQNAEATAVTNGQAVEAAYDLVGKAIVMPFANKENFIQGYASTTGGSATTIIASCGASTKCYITGVQCYNTSATTITVTLTDSASTVLIVPAGGGNNASFETPLATAAATAFQFTASTGETTIGCAAQGYKGT